MDEREARLRAIRSVIKEERIDSQEALLERLAAEGFNVTQATLSRDLRHLKVAKVPDGASGSYYALPSGEQRVETDASLLDDIVRGWIAIDFSDNIAVVRTLSGHANSVAYAIDRMAMPELLGTVAGDDTVIMVTRQGISREKLKELLRARLPGLEI